MSIKIEVTYTPDEPLAGSIRTLFCRESKGKGNPLLETGFNELLQRIAQAAFDEGRRFERGQPKGEND